MKKLKKIQDSIKKKKWRKEKLKKEKLKRQEARKIESQKRVYEFKKIVFKALEDTQIKPKIVKQFYLIKSIDVLKHHIMIKLKEEHHIKLREAGIDFYVERKKKKKRKKHNTGSKSIKPIYTPMGNKR